SIGGCEISQEVGRHSASGGSKNTGSVGRPGSALAQSRSSTELASTDPTKSTTSSTISAASSRHTRWRRGAKTTARPTSELSELQQKNTAAGWVAYGNVTATTPTHERGRSSSIASRVPSHWTNPSAITWQATARLATLS